jgi:integrase
MLTGQRRNEIAALSWSEIAGDTIVFPKSRTKNGREHLVPVVPLVRDILDTRTRRDDDNFVFGRSRGKPFRGFAVCKEALDQRIAAAGTELKPWTHHDLRRTMATRLAELQTAPHIIEAILNHVGHKRGVAGIYNRATYEVPKRIALQTWADYVERIVSGKQSAKVVPLRGA